MAKWSGNIGYAETVETEPGIWEEQITEHHHYGDVIHNNMRYQTTNKVNDNITISNQISVVATLYANKHINQMKYVEFMGTKWKISDIEVQYHRLILTLGEVYDVEQD